jgi:hypothetical protein
MEPAQPILANQEITQTIYIVQDSYKYPLHLNSTGDIINFILEYNTNNYKKTISLKEIKDKESEAILSSFKPRDFMDYLKTLSEMKKISLVKTDNIINIKFELEIMFKKHEIEIELISKDKNIELIEKEIKELKEENKELKINNNKIQEENKELKKRIENLEIEIKEIKKILNTDFNINKLNNNISDIIMNENEFKLINLGIKYRLNKKVKGLKKLYQALIDGDDVINFHSKCDNIPNTLVLIKSEGNRRFGGFTSIPWTSPEKDEFKDDPNAFLFSLDKQRIYSYVKNGKAIYNNKNYGPWFGFRDIYIYQHCIEEKGLYTGESRTDYSSYNYNGDKNALSEGNNSSIYAADYEVFQVIFE